MPKISRRTADLPASPIRKLAPLAAEAQRKGKTVYNLNIGQPDIPTPRSFMNGVRNADVSVLSYSPSTGLPETLEALSRYYAEHGIRISVEEMCVTIGGSEAFTFAMKAAMDAGDEVIIPEPFYPNYRGYACLTNVKLVPITTYAEEGFHLPPSRRSRRGSRPARVRSSSPTPGTRPAWSTHARSSSGSLPSRCGTTCS